jgi:hypothetical protein
MQSKQGHEEPTQHAAIIEMAGSWGWCVRREGPASIESAFVKTALTTWLLLFGLLLQSVAWVLPAQRLGQTERLAHQVAHALDHGHHPHEGLGHDVDTALQLPGDLDEGRHGPHHTHASEGAPLQGLPVAALLAALALPSSTLRTSVAAQPSSADLAGPLRPPQFLL